METALIRIEIASNRLLSAAGTALFFASLCCVCLGGGALAAARGCWPALPFAGLELALPGWALATSLRRRHCWQRITSRKAHVCEQSHGGAQPVFSAGWARVKLRRPSSRLCRSRLAIESRGRQCEVGSFLTEEERRGLALRLQGLIGRVNESPSPIGRR